MFWHVGANNTGEFDTGSKNVNSGCILRAFGYNQWEIVLFPESSSKLSAKWQGLFGVTWQVGEVDWGQVNRQGQCITNITNLLKLWMEAILVDLAMVILKRVVLGPEVNLKNAAQLTPLPCGHHLSLSLKAEVAQLQSVFWCVFAPFMVTLISQNTIHWDSLGDGCTQPPLLLTRTQKTGGSEGAPGYTWFGCKWAPQ